MAEYWRQAISQSAPQQPGRCDVAQELDEAGAVSGRQDGSEAETAGCVGNANENGNNQQTGDNVLHASAWAAEPLTGRHAIAEATDGTEAVAAATGDEAASEKRGREGTCDIAEDWETGARRRQRSMHVDRQAATMPAGNRALSSQTAQAAQMQERSEEPDLTCPAAAAMLANGQYVVAETVVGLFDEGSGLTSESVVIHRDGRVELSTDLLERVAATAQGEYSDQSTFEALQGWHEGVLVTEGLRAGRAMRTTDEQGMPKDVTALQVIQHMANGVQARPLPPATETTAASVWRGRDYFTGWVETTSWPSLAGTNVPIQLYGRMPEGATRNYVGTSALMEAVLAGKVATTCRALTAGE